MAGSKVTIGKERVLQVNGEPFFPLCARHTPVGGTPNLLREAGFNAMRWTPFGVDALPRPAKLADDLGGLMFYPYVYVNGDLSKEVERRREALTALVQEVREHPSLLCWEQRNEPAYTLRDPSRPQAPPDGLIAGSQIIRELDPHHPIRVGHMVCNLTSTLRAYNRAVDIVGCNPYVVIPPGMRAHVGFRPDGKLVDCPNQTLSAVGDLTTKMMRVAQGRPVWMQIQGSANENWFNEEHTPENRGHGSYEHLRVYPSRWQMRFMAFHAIIRGATGLEWMLIGHPVGSGSWKDVSCVIGELSALHDVLCAPNCPRAVAVEYSELGFSDWTGVELLVKLHEGQPWILSANTQFDPMEVRFSNLPDGLEECVQVVAENRRIPIREGAFSDRFQPYEVHVYTAAGRDLG